jgi:hypothetical protein
MVDVFEIEPLVSHWRFNDAPFTDLSILPGIHRPIIWPVDNRWERVGME